MLNEYNAGRVGPANHLPLWVFARDPSGKIQGGARGQIYWSWCTIDVLSRCRFALALLARLEEIARKRGCVGIRLDTTSFQAPDFYRRHEYIEYGRIEGYPPGHTRLWFIKRL
jgi:hypothetical protein